MIIRDTNYRVIGYIEETSGGVLVAKNARMEIKGFYDPKANRTTDAHMRTVGYGNLLSSVLHPEPHR